MSAVVPPQFLNISQQGADVVLTWTNSSFKLQSADAVTGSYLTLAAATSPHSNAPTQQAQYFRLIYAP